MLFSRVLFVFGCVVFEGYLSYLGSLLEIARVFVFWFCGLLGFFLGSS